MAAITSISQTNHYPPPLRAFDIRRDLVPVADLVELCFADSLDADGRRFITRMRKAAQDKGIFGFSSAGIQLAQMPMFGYVWEQDGALIGNISLVPYMIQRRPSFLIANVAVHPDYRRRGIAKALTDQCLEHARNRHASHVWLHVREENLPAVNLYRSIGFLEFTRRTTWLSEKRLSAAPQTQEFQQPRISKKSWKAIARQLKRSYPSEITWNMKFSLGLYRPGISGEIARLLYPGRVQRWVLESAKNDPLFVALQSTQSSYDSLWLAARSDACEEDVQYILKQCLADIAKDRPIRLDYPVGHSENGIQAAGFKIQQKLVWMRLPL